MEEYSDIVRFIVDRFRAGWTFSQVDRAVMRTYPDLIGSALSEVYAEARARLDVEYLGAADEARRCRDIAHPKLAWWRSGSSSPNVAARPRATGGPLEGAGRAGAHRDGALRCFACRYGAQCWPTWSAPRLRPGSGGQPDMTLPRRLRMLAIRLPIGTAAPPAVGKGR